MKSTFIEKLIDWKEFELFIKKLYEQDESLEAEHDVMLIGKSGARRQIDVLITQKTKLHEYKTIIECKRWKEKVDRSRVDILYASIEDLNASKGVIFTTTGFEEGAELYAQSKNIDLFIVRDLTPEEWGLPGREIHFYLQTFCAKLINLQFPNAQMIPIVENYPKNLDIKIIVEKEQKYDDSQLLYSKADGKKGLNLVSLLIDKQNEIVGKISNGIGLIGEGKIDEELVITSEIEISFENYEFNQLRYPYGIVTLNKMKATLITHVSQKTFHFDRGEKIDIALTIENYIRKQKYVAFQRNEDTNIEITENLMDKLTKEKIAHGEVLQNNSILKVFLAPYVDFTITGKEKSATTETIKVELYNSK
ncbi:restriction endonuclease [Leptospira sp. 201903074]|uniref:restriction endonuclease n=1 Tax=Leptospira abararensis TaxID=2810036 RepID=UPI001964AB6D|nr:restriction endonuclease [Leptospira abararensis]MBM9547453.1 restriction endonuclease [Leptospira abararensis]